MHQGAITKHSASFANHFHGKWPETSKKALFFEAEYDNMPRVF